MCTVEVGVLCTVEDRGVRSFTKVWLPPYSDWFVVVPNSVSTAMYFILLVIVTPTSTWSSKDWGKVSIYHTQVIPAVLTVLEGTSVKLYCGSPKPVTWTYSVDRLPVPGSHELGNNSITLKNLSGLGDKLYYCKGIYFYQNLHWTSFVNTIKFTVKD